MRTLAQPAVGIVAGCGSTIAWLPATLIEEAPIELAGTLMVGSFNALSNVPIRLLLNVVFDVIRPDGAK